MIQIITDSAADFEPREYEEKGVVCIPLTVVFNQNEYRETVNLSKDLFYDLLVNSPGFPRTSQPSPEELMTCLQTAKNNGDDAVVITLSSKLSGTCQGVVLAKDLIGYENCYIVDGLNATGGQRMLVEYALRLREEGASAMEIAAKVEALRPHIVLYACVDTLEYLHRGGRISGTAYRVGSFANIKPIIHVSEGEVKVPAKAMGMRKGMDYLCNRVQAIPPDMDFPLYVMYTGDRTNGEVLANRLAEQGIAVPAERIINVGAAIGSHVGPGACGVVYKGRE